MDNIHNELIAKKLRTGEIAIWDHDSKSVILISDPSSEQVSTRVIKGASLKALEEVLGKVIVLG